MASSRTRDWTCGPLHWQVELYPLHHQGNPPNTQAFNNNIKKTYCPPFVCHSHNLGFESAHLIFSAPGLFDFMCFRKGRAPSTTLWSEPQISCRGVKSTCLRRSIRPLLPVFHPVPPGYVALAVHKGSIGHRQVGMEFLFTRLARWWASFFFFSSFALQCSHTYFEF